MIAKARSKLPSTKLNVIFEEINSTLGKAKELVLKAYNQALEENYSPQQAKQLLLDNITVFKKTQIYAYLPSECKDSVKQKAGYLSHKTEVSVPIPEQKLNTKPEQSNSDNYADFQLDRADNYLDKLQSENMTLKKEIENISNNVIPEALMKKDRQIGELQREKAELIKIHQNEIQQLKSRGSPNGSGSKVFCLDDPQPEVLMKRAQESTSKMMTQKTYYKDLPLIADVTLPLQVHIYPEKDECLLEIDKKMAQEVFVRACKGLEQYREGKHFE